VTIYYFFSYCSIVYSLTFESSIRAQRQAVKLTSFFLKISDFLCSSQASTLVFEQETLKEKAPLLEQIKAKNKIVGDKLFA